MKQRTVEIRSLSLRGSGLWIVLVAALFMGVAVGCYNTNTGEASIGGAINFTLPAFPQTGPHAVVIFSEMQFQPSYRVQEIPRIHPAEGAVPITGREVRYSSAEEYQQLSIPSAVSGDAAQSIAKGKELVRVNCQVCHGNGLRGNGAVVGFIGDKGPKPPDLIGGSITSSTAGEVFALITFGGRAGFASAMRDRPTPSWMPEFGKLLTEEERWQVVTYLRSLQGK